MAKVIGTAVATVKHPAYKGRKVMVVAPLGTDGKKKGSSFLAVDAVQAGVGDRVLVAREGNAARQVLGTGEAPIHAVILSIIDEVEVS